MAEDLPQLHDAAPGMYEALLEVIENGHNDTCDKLFDQTGPPEHWNLDEQSEENCTCGIREAKKAVAYARGDDPLEVDTEGGYQV